MKIGLKLGRYGMSMEEATIVRWHCAPGETFKLGAILYEIETDKVVQEVVAEGEGKLLEVRVPEGEVAAVGQIVCMVEVTGSGR